MSITIERPRPKAAKHPIKPAAGAEPRILEMPSERMAVVETVGDPNKVGKEAISALYGAVYGLKFAEKKMGRDFKVKPLRARWSNWRDGDASALRGTWGLPVPPLTRVVPQKLAGLKVELQTWRYGTVAEILHLGPYAAELPTIARLVQFIHEQGYEVAGLHEEEYLSGPQARVPKTLIRYPIKKVH